MCQIKWNNPTQDIITSPSAVTGRLTPKHHASTNQTMKTVSAQHDQTTCRVMETSYDTFYFFDRGDSVFTTKVSEGSTWSVDTSVASASHFLSVPKIEPVMSCAAQGLTRRRPAPDSEITVVEWKGLHRLWTSTVRAGSSHLEENPPPPPGCQWI